MLRHHAPFRDHGFAHLPGLLRTGDFVDLQRDLLADKTFQLRGLRVVAGDDLKCLRPGLEIAKPVRRRQPVRLADQLKGVDALARFAAADTHGIELSRKHVAGIDQLARLRRGLGLLREGGRRS